MKLKRAIEIHKDILYLRRPVEMKDHTDAIQLGMEAMEELLFYRNTSMPAQCIVLKSETPEEE